MLRNLQTMTESTQRLSDEAKSKHPDIEWSVISAFRNVLVHDYIGIDTERIWETITKDVPKFRNPDPGQLKNHHIQFIHRSLQAIWGNNGGKLFPGPKLPFLSWFSPQIRFLAVPGNKFGDILFSPG